MRDGFIKVAAVTPKVRVADTVYNAKKICEGIRGAAEQGAKVIVLPELSVTGYTCGDLFLQETLWSERLRRWRKSGRLRWGATRWCLSGCHFPTRESSIIQRLR